MFLKIDIEYYGTTIHELDRAIITYVICLWTLWTLWPTYYKGSRVLRSGILNNLLIGTIIIPTYSDDLF